MNRSSGEEDAFLYLVNGKEIEVGSNKKELLSVPLLQQSCHLGSFGVATEIDWDTEIFKKDYKRRLHESL